MPDMSRELVAASSRPLIPSILSRGESYGYAIILSFTRGTWQNTAKLMPGRVGVGKLLTLWVGTYGIISVLQPALNHVQVRLQSPSLGELANVAVSASISNSSTQLVAVTTIVVLTAMLGRRFVTERA
jgi:hypothetical protein